MFVELIEALRCPREHEESSLVAAAIRTEARHITHGTLGCPVCNAEFVIANGVVHFDAPARATPSEPPTAETAMRLAAFLELTDARGFALLCGSWGAHAGKIHELSDTPLVLVNPPSPASADAAGVVMARDVIPFAAGSARALAIDAGASAAFVASALDALAPGGRVLGPVSLPVPAGVVEIARDVRAWVAQKNAASHATPRLVSLQRAPR